GVGLRPRFPRFPRFRRHFRHYYLACIALLAHTALNAAAQDDQQAHLSMCPSLRTPSPLETNECTMGAVAHCPPPSLLPHLIPSSHLI
ncbi:hypothetical protein DFH08DRAFT_848454, partial [Mycena albidolilacea]